MVLVGKMGQTIMAGDPMQMPPIVIDEHSKRHGLNISILSRLLRTYSNFAYDVSCTSTQHLVPHNVNRFYEILQKKIFFFLFTQKSGHERVFGSRLVSKLIENYRCLPSILGYINKQFYNCELIPMIDGNDSREAKLLRHLDGIFPDYKYPGKRGIHFVNVDGQNQKSKTSWFNVFEVRVVSFVVHFFFFSKF